MSVDDRATVISPTAKAVIRYSGDIWYEATYLAAAAYLSDLDGRLHGPVHVLVDGRELSTPEQAFMVEVGREYAGDRRIPVEMDGRMRDVLVKRSAMRVLWGADQDATSDAIVAAHRSFWERLARDKATEEGIGADELIELGSEDVEG